MDSTDLLFFIIRMSSDLEEYCLEYIFLEGHALLVLPSCSAMYDKMDIPTGDLGPTDYYLSYIIPSATNRIFYPEPLPSPNSLLFAIQTLSIRVRSGPFISLTMFMSTALISGKSSTPFGRSVPIFPLTMSTRQFLPCFR